MPSKAAFLFLSVFKVANIGLQAHVLSIKTKNKSNKDESICQMVRFELKYWRHCHW